ncbi:hypothetical protein TWF481_004756 [Arthrobotrys musiformis]|uniref:Uncharacterized protein n=1 Tax=Arthrobotrys musiformis TaxID=47236 RepID=A0AAV9WR79_9PEZI
MSRTTKSKPKPKPAPRSSSKRRISTPYNNIDYKANVLAPDNVRILEKDIISKLGRLDRSGQNMLDLYFSIKDRIVCHREQTTAIDSLVATCYRILGCRGGRRSSFGQHRNPDWEQSLDESLTSQEVALDIAEYLWRSDSRMAARLRRGEKKKRAEELFQDHLIAEVKIFQNLLLHEGDLQGMSNHKINKEIGPENVTANIKDHIKPDYLCGYPDPESVFSISRSVWEKIPESIRLLTPNAGRTTESLFLPFLAFELKWRGTPERIVKNQLARCLSIIAERQARLEELSNNVSTKPIFGLTGVERNFTLWVMFRYETDCDENKVHYDMCELASYDLTSEEHVEEFRAAMTNIHDWVENERKAHFMQCISSIKP